MQYQGLPQRSCGRQCYPAACLRRSNPTILKRHCDASALYLFGVISRLECPRRNISQTWNPGLRGFPLDKVLLWRWHTMSPLTFPKWCRCVSTDDSMLTESMESKAYKGPLLVWQECLKSAYFFVYTINKTDGGFVKDIWMASGLSELWSARSLVTIPNFTLGSLSDLKRLGYDFELASRYTLTVLYMGPVETIYSPTYFQDSRKVWSFCVSARLWDKRHSKSYPRRIESSMNMFLPEVTQKPQMQKSI